LRKSFPLLFVVCIAWTFPFSKSRAYRCGPFGDSLETFRENFVPKHSVDELVISHKAFSVCYNEHHEQAQWVAYRLTAAMCLNNSEERGDDFRADNDVLTGSASPADYRKSGYDRGHLCPAGDMAWNDVAMSESFLMSNMSPQLPAFNRGIWKKLEGNVRQWAKDNEEVFVVTAGVLNGNLKSIGGNKVSVPEFYYKVVLDAKPPELKAIAFVMPNCANKVSVFNYAVSIDSVEHLTGIDFFPALPDSLENELESRFSVNLWNVR
jgi:endonuclease G